MKRKTMFAGPSCSTMRTLHVDGGQFIVLTGGGRGGGGEERIKSIGLNVGCFKVDTANSNISPC